MRAEKDFRSRGKVRGSEARSRSVCPQRLCDQALDLLRDSVKARWIGCERLRVGLIGE